MGKNSNISHGHHFLSQCYLKGFTPLGTKESLLFTLNLIDRKSFSTAPKNVAKERDFNLVEIDGLKPDYLESQLALFENTADAAIRNVERTGKFESEDRIIILNLIALFFVRNPYRRAYWNSIQDHTTKLLLSMAATNVGGITNGILITPEFKNFVDDGRFKIEPHQNDQINLELSVLDSVIQCLVRRKWTLVHAKDDLRFIANDIPVILTWKDDKEYLIGPGFASPGSQVCFPLTKKLVLVGDFEGKDCNVGATERTMGAINSLIFASATQWLYTETGDFIFLKHTGELASGITTFWNYFGSDIAVA